MATEQQKTVVELSPSSLRQAVVNRAVLTLLGLSEDKALGQNITITFVAVGDPIEGEAQRIESAPTAYEIVGITSEEDTRCLWPLVECAPSYLFSQIKVIAPIRNDLP